jgi:hypothetical protein
VKSAEDRATTAQAAAANVVMERESLEAKLAQAEVTVEELPAVITAANEATKKATAAAETAA